MNLDWLHRSDFAVVDNVPQILTSVRVNPVLMHLEDDYRFHVVALFPNSSMTTRPVVR